MAAPLEWTSRVALLVLVASAAWLYGGVEQGFRSAAAAGLAVIGAMTLVAGVRSRKADSPGTFVAILAPLGLAVLAGMQLFGGGVPLDAGGDWLTPRTLYPAETRLALGGILATGAAAYFGAALFARRDAFRFLLLGLVVIGTGTAVLGMGLRLTGEERLIRGESVAGEPFAYFVNRNNAAGFLQICLAAGLVLLWTGRDPGDARFSERGFAAAVRRFSGDRLTLALVALVGTGACFAGIVASRSRGGVVAALLTVLVVPLCGLRRGGLRHLAVGLPVAAVSVGLLLWLGLASPTVARFQSMRGSGVLEDGRVRHWIDDAFEAFKARPLWGGGAGAYGVSYSEFAEYPSEKTFEHADGQFVEVAVETGAAGILVLLAATCVLAAGLARYGIDRPVPATALIGLLVGQAAHAAFDFAVTVPAVAVAAGLLAGASLGGLYLREDFDREDSGREDSAVREPARRFAWWAKAGVSAALCGGLAWASVEHARASVVDRGAGTAARLLKRPGVSPDSLDPMIRYLTAGLRERPDDAEGQRALGDLWVQRYRLAAASRISEIDPSLKPEAVRQATNLVSLHRTVNVLGRAGAVAGLAGVREDPLVRENLEPGRRHYQAAADACPRLRRVWLPLACLSFLSGESPAGRREVETELRFHKADPVTLRLAGRLAWQAGEAELAGRCWRRAFSLTPEEYGDVAGRLSAEVGPAEAVALTLPEHGAAALQVCSPGRITDAGLRGAIGPRLASAADSLDGPAAARAGAIAAWFAGRDGEAESRFSESVARYPSDAATRADFAAFLRDVGRFEEAAESLSLASALDPQADEYRRLLASWNRDTPLPPGPPSKGGGSPRKK